MSSNPKSNPIIHLLPNRLKLHPRNMRQYYPDDQVAEMASSILASKGVWQALLVVASGEYNEAGEEVYLVFDGNLRLAAGRHLGHRCPPLKCEIFELAEAEQLLAMATTSEFHFKKDPISEAKHYRRLRDEEGYSIRQIHHCTGISEPKISGTMLWLDLEEQIQELVGRLKLHCDRRVAEALLSIPDSQIRVKLALGFASRKTSIKGIEASCKRMSKIKKGQGKTVPIDKFKPIYIPPPTKQVVTAASRLSMCPDCTTVINELAEELCGACSVNGLTEDCLLCPGVIEFVGKLIETIRGSGHVH